MSNTMRIGTTTAGYVIYVPPNHNVTGTCGRCGGPVVQPMIWSGTDPRPEWCLSCNARPKTPITEAWGPMREMESA